MKSKKHLSALRGALTAVLTPFLMFSAGAATAAGPYFSSGVLYLDLGTTNQFKYGAVAQPVNAGSGSSCALTPSSGELVSISTTGGTPGFNKKKEWLGVQETSQGVDCGRISAPLQSWSLALSRTDTSPLKVSVVQQTTLKLNAKKNAVIRANLFLNGVPTGRVFYFRSGLSADGILATDETECNAGISDSNPDSGASCEWKFPKGTEVPAQWDRVTLTAETGEIGVGGPGTVSEFRLAIPAQGLLGCDTSNRDIDTTVGNNGLVFDGVRLANVADPKTPTGEPNPPACAVVPYAVSPTCPAGVIGTSCVNFLYDPLNQGTHMAFHFTWQWPIEALPTGGIDAIPNTLQLFINGSATPVELDICPHTKAVYVDGEFDRLIADPLYTGPNPHPQDQDLTAAGTQAGCLIHRDVLQDGTGLKLVEEAWVQGDYVSLRR